jgi:hypothetical protein
MALALAGVSDLAATRQEYERAIAVSQEGLALAREVNDRFPTSGFEKPSPPPRMGRRPNSRRWVSSVQTGRFNPGAPGSQPAASAVHVISPDLSTLLSTSLLYHFGVDSR